MFRPVHLSKFTRDGLHIVSGSDDKSVRVYDIPTETEVVSFTEHQVIVHIFITSCYRIEVLRKNVLLPISTDDRR